MILKIKYKKFFGFSLAEVLIALVVIGIVSAITVPTLMASYQKNVTLFSVLVNGVLLGV